MSLQLNYLNNVKSTFEYYKLVGEKTINQLSNEQLFWQYNEASNSVAITVNHICGNMLSRWTDFLTTDGEKTWRNRDTEFEDIIKTKAQLLAKWNSGWACLFTALNSINETNFNNQILIRNEAHTIIEAINRQLAHYAYHIGQIVYIGKMQKGNNWQSLTIPKGKSVAYNSEMFGKAK